MPGTFRSVPKATPPKKSNKMRCRSIRLIAADPRMPPVLALFTPAKICRRSLFVLYLKSWKQAIPFFSEWMTLSHVSSGSDLSDRSSRRGAKKEAAASLRSSGLSITDCGRMGSGHSPHFQKFRTACLLIEKAEIDCALNKAQNLFSQKELCLFSKRKKKGKCLPVPKNYSLFTLRSSLPKIPNAEISEK